MNYGYAEFRPTIKKPMCSTRRLKEAGCNKLFPDDGISGPTTKRAALLRCLKAFQHGDTLNVWKFDPLSRSLRDLITMLDDPKARGVEFRALTSAIDTETPTGRHVM